MNANPLKKLNALGQSIWLDFVSRKLLADGDLRRLIDEDGISGVTSNPSIFQKAISGSAEYDPQFKRLLAKGVTDPRDIFFALATEDIAEAADQLRQAYDNTNGLDGYVSIEVSPDLAHDTEATVKEALKLFAELDRPNVLIKVPATLAGLPAVERLIAAGINVNVTLLFAVDRYEAVMEAYLRGLETRAADGKPINKIGSVASFFVSRVDSAVDKALKAKGNTDLPGKAAVANAQLAYKRYRNVFGSARFRALAAKGAMPQRILWASTGTKDPAYSDIKYVEELTAPNSVNTLPEGTINAFRDHGRAALNIERGIDRAEGVFASLAALGIDMRTVTDKLEEEGVKAFVDAFFELLAEIEGKRGRL